MTPWWGTRSNVSPRLRLEVEAMRATFGNTFRLTVPAHAPLYWEGTVELNLASLPQPNHLLKIVYPDNYPNRPAEAYVQEPEIKSLKQVGTLQYRILPENSTRLCSLGLAARLPRVCRLCPALLSSLNIR